VLSASRIQIVHTKDYVEQYRHQTALDAQPTGKWKRSTSKGEVNGDHFIEFFGDMVDVFDSVGVFAGGSYIVDEKRLIGVFELDGVDLTITERSGKVTHHNFWVEDGSSTAPTLISYDGTVYVQ
jgi:hypothetical protein